MFDLSVPGRVSASFRTSDLPDWVAADLVPEDHLRPEPLPIVEVSERDLVAHFTRLSHRQFSVDLGAYPLGSCTMKYNPKVCDEVAKLDGLTGVHPAVADPAAQGWLALLVELESVLCQVVGMHSATLQPPAGAAGELTGLLLARAWHLDSEGSPRRRVLIPDSAHGTNPASVTLAGYEVTQVPSDSRGLVDLDALKSAMGPDVAAVMLTNPNTLGLFEEDITEIAAVAHAAGALLYYDGANLNAVLGVTRPGDMGFDIVHMNLHKTFAVPHGGGGPGAGPVAVAERLAPYLPGPRPAHDEVAGSFGWVMPERSIGRVHSWHGNALALARAWSYIVANGADGLRRVSEAAVLNANWLRQQLRGTYDLPYDRPCMHEFVASAAGLRRRSGVKAMDIAKALLDEGFHSPTVYFPLIVEEALMVEPTETESPQTMRALADAFIEVAGRLAAEPEPGSHPRLTPLGRLDEARAARRLIPTWDARPEA